MSDPITNVSDAVAQLGALPVPVGSRGTALERLEARTDRSGSCWLWTGRLNNYGYAEMKLDGRYQMAHRVAYQKLVGPIEAGLQLDHRCHSEDDSCEGGIGCVHRRCVNPAHLEPVTARENTMRSAALPALNAAKTHCLRGHAFDEANTYLWRNSRICRQCRRQYRRKTDRSQRNVSSMQAAS